MQYFLICNLLDCWGKLAQATRANKIKTAKKKRKEKKRTPCRSATGSDYNGKCPQIFKTIQHLVMLFLPFTVVGMQPLLTDNLDQKDILSYSVELMFHRSLRHSYSEKQRQARHKGQQITKLPNSDLFRNLTGMVFLCPRYVKEIQ